ncbi:MAG: sugar phosphate nucleotidyltransferase [Candidatus Kapabacteria bacterium]|nr:sugar phosphate nucleotidyltransferase [Candidatus Kapabacteria bacterium]
MKAVILAGGLGVRLRPLTGVIPKPMLPIGEKAVLEIQIEHLKEHGFNEIYLATNYKSEFIEGYFGDGSKFGVKLKISKEDKQLGTAGPVTLLRDELTEPYIVMNGDILSNCNFSKMYEFALEKKDTDLVVGIKEFVAPFRFGNIFYDGDYVTNIEEKKDFKTKILAGIYVFKPGLFEIIPYNEHFDMDKLILKMLELKKPIAKYEISEYWLDIGQIDDYQLAQDVYETYFRK